MSRERVTGQIVNVWTRKVTTSLTTDAAIAATVLSVDDCSVCEGVERVKIADQLVAVSDFDDDASTLTIAEGLTVAAEDGTDVVIWNEVYDEADTVQRAEVAPDDDHDGDTIRATVDDELELVDGDRGGRGERCVLKRDDDDWTLARVTGRPAKARGIKWESDDAHTLTSAEVTAGTFTHTLLHSNIVDHHEFLALVNGVALGPDRYDLDADAGVVTVTLGGWETTADDFRFHYGYRKGPHYPPPDPEFVLASAIQSFEPVPDLPAGTQAGDLAVCFLNDRGTGVPTILNGYTVHASAGPVTGGTYGGWTITDCRMHVLSKVVSGPTDKFAGTVVGVGGGDPIGCWVILRNAEVSAVATDIETASVAAGDTPASPTASPQLLLRAWSALMSGNIFPPAGRGTLLANSSWTNQDMAVISDTDPTVATATCATATRWLGATVVIGGA